MGSSRIHCKLALTPRMVKEGIVKEGIASWTPTICFEDKRSKTVLADVVSCKGPEDLRAVDATVGHIMQLGHPEVMLRVDSGNAAKVLRDTAAAKLQEKTCGL